MYFDMKVGKNSAQMSSNHQSLETTCKQFLDSLLSSTTRHTLCLNIAEPDYDATKMAVEYLSSKTTHAVATHTEPTSKAFAEVLDSIAAGQTVVVHFDDLDKHPKCIDLLAEYVKKPHPRGHLVVVSRQWNSDNTVKERELRKSCLFYQQNLAVKKKGE
jgi:hypothetical protein